MICMLVFRNFYKIWYLNEIDKIEFFIYYLFLNNFFLIN